MIPITLITGFLGSGKTSLLKHITQTHGDRRLLFLVNDFPPKDVDGARLELAGDLVTSIAGGSVFCRCKVNDFVEALRRIRKADPPPEGLVIEASGMANPKSMTRSLRENMLDQAFAHVRTVAVIDPMSFLRLWQTLPAVRAQVEAASTVLINKRDRSTPDERVACEELVRSINPTAGIAHTEHARHELDLLADTTPPEAMEDYAACRDINFFTAQATIPGPVDWNALRTAIDALGGGIYRAKGTVPLGDGALVVDLSASGWDVRRAAQAVATGDLALIGAGAQQDDLLEVAARIEAGRYAASI
ncbi:MAG: CobW family GTP-binding protein [Planctomycetota bacterium]